MVAQLLRLRSSSFSSSSSSSSSSFLRLPTRSSWTTTTTPTPPRQTHTLVLLRHGESLYNVEHRFTGWADVPLTARGEAHADEAGELLRARGFRFDRVLTSGLERAQRTAERCVQALARGAHENEDSGEGGGGGGGGGAAAAAAAAAGEKLTVEGTTTTTSEQLQQLQQQPPASSTRPRIDALWELNERHYGALQRRRKDDAALLAEHGADQVCEWRRSYDATPPPMTPAHADYAGASKQFGVFTESLHDCQDRVATLWHEKIAPAVASGEKLLIVAHANTIRALIMIIDDISSRDIRKVKVPNAVPLVYHLASSSASSSSSASQSGATASTSTTDARASGLLVPVDPEDELHFHGEYLACTSNHQRVADCYEAHNSALKGLWESLVADPRLVDDRGRLCVKELTRRAGRLVRPAAGGEFDVCQMLTSLELMRESVQRERCATGSSSSGGDSGNGGGDAADDDRISYAEFVLAFSAPSARFHFSGKKKFFQWLQ